MEMDKRFADELRKRFEKETGEKVKAILDFDEESFVVSFDTDAIPGKMYRINKTTGEAAYFLPTMDLKKFGDAVKNRAFLFD